MGAASARMKVEWYICECRVGIGTMTSVGVELAARPYCARQVYE